MERYVSKMSFTIMGNEGMNQMAQATTAITLLGLCLNRCCAVEDRVDSLRHFFIPDWDSKSQSFTMNGRLIEAYRTSCEILPFHLSVP